MEKTIRPKIGADDDLEQLQDEFFAKGQISSASVVRATPPSFGSTPKKKSIFSQRQEASRRTTLERHEDNSDDLSGMPDLEDADQHTDSHAAVSKKMLDLSSLLGNVLGEVKEKHADTVEPPAIRSGGTRSFEHAQGFPRPARRSLFRQRMEKTSGNAANDESASERHDLRDYERENQNRIDAMTEEEIEEARKEILSTLSSDSITVLMNRTKRDQQHTDEKPTQANEQESGAWKARPSPDILKPALVDDHAESANVNEQQQQSEFGNALHQMRFNYRGIPLEPVVDLAPCQGHHHHHHTEAPEKAGYTLAELFNLTRSHMPSQRAMALNTIAYIAQHAKKNSMDYVLDIFHRADSGAVMYLHSSLGDNHLMVLVSAVNALAAILLDENEDIVDRTMDVEQFNEYLGYISSSRVASRLHGNQDTKGQNPEGDAQLEDQNLHRGLLNTDLLPRLRYLMLPSSELRRQDSASIEKIVRIIAELARSGFEVCKAIQDHQLLDLALDWGLLERDWPMTQKEKADKYPSLASLRLLTVLAQGNRDVASAVAPRAGCLFQYLITPANVACEPLQKLAYALQVETLKLFQVLLCYGLVVPGFSDLHEPMMACLRVSMTTMTVYDDALAATMIRVLENMFHAAADPHKTTPKHAIDWCQPTAFLPMVLAVLRTCKSSMALDAAMGYFATYASYFNRFPAEDGAVNNISDAWAAVSESNGIPRHGKPNSVLRYLQFLNALGLIKQASLDGVIQAARESLKRMTHVVRSIYQDGVLGRLAMWVWMSSVVSRKERIQLWGSEAEYGLAELESTASSVYGGAIESSLARKFIRVCVLDRLDPSIAKVLSPFYMGRVDHEDVSLDQDLTSLKTLMLPEMTDTTANFTAWIFSPVDEVYHGEKSSVALGSSSPVTVIAAALEAASALLEPVSFDHDVAIVSMMKVFFIEDRSSEASVGCNSEVFWDQHVSRLIKHWLNNLCKTHMGAPFTESVQDAWRRSSTYARQSFYQFYQSFVAHYASTSFGEHSFARLLAYISIEADDTVDFRHLLWSDYHEVLPTIKASHSDLPSMTHRSECSTALLHAYLSAVMGNTLSRDKDNDAMYRFAIQELECSRNSGSVSPELRQKIEEALSQI